MLSAQDAASVARVDAAFTPFIQRIDAIFTTQHADLEASKAAWKTAARSNPEAYAALKDLCAPSGRYLDNWGGPSATAVLQRCIELGGVLAEWATGFLDAHPREVWHAVGERVRLRNGSLLAAWRDGSTARVAFGDGRSKFDVFDAYDFALLGTLKLDAYARAFVGPDTVRALLRDGRAIEQRLTDKKPKVLAELGPIDDGAIDADHVVGLLPKDQDEGTRRHVVVIDGVEREPPSVETQFFYGPGIVGGTVFVPVVEKNGDTILRGGFARIDGDRVDVEWFAPLPSGGSAPPSAELADAFQSVDGTTFVTTRRDRGAVSRRWVRAGDLVEDARFGSRFDHVHTCGDAVWSARGERVKSGVRTAPIAFRGVCVATLPLADDHVICSVRDPATKGEPIELIRFRRFRP